MNLLANTPAGALPQETSADAFTVLLIGLAFVAVLWFLERGAPE